MQTGKKLSDYVGKNEKTKIVVKLQKRGTGPPGREPVVNEEEKKQMMLQAYRRQEELKVSLGTLLPYTKFSTAFLLFLFSCLQKLENVEDDRHLDSQWADNNMLKRQFQGLNNISWRPGKRF